MAEQSLRLDGRKVCIIKRLGISQAESNKATVCALPSSHLPFFEGRQVRWQFSRDSAVLGGLVWGKAVVLLRRLWE